LGYFAEPEKVILVSRWEEVLALLQTEYAGIAAWWFIPLRTFNIVPLRADIGAQF